MAPNRLARCFDVDAPEQAWVADITAIWTLEGWLYLATVMDLDDRQVVGWAMAGPMRTELALDAVEMALGRRRPPPGLIHYSDRGSQYAAREYRDRLAEHERVASMSARGDGWDNAVMERFFGSLKSEWTDSQRYATRRHARRDIADTIEMPYNGEQLHSTLDYIPPREQELAAVA